MPSTRVLIARRVRPTDGSNRGYSQWQLTQERLKARRSFIGYGLRVVRGRRAWHGSHRRGCSDPKQGGLLEPCAWWQFRQFSRTGGCSQRNGPRLSAWQVVHVFVDGDRRQ